MKKIEVVAAIIHDDRGRIFATQRGYGEYKDWWEFPGGKMEVGETPEEALQREIWEELETRIAVERLVETVEYDYPAFHLTMHCYLCHVESGQLELKEHEAAQWLTHDKLDSVNWLPADRALVEKLAQNPFSTKANKNSNMDTERITEMEQRMDRTTAAVETLEAAMERYQAVLDDITALNAYLGSDEWHDDRADDAANRLPSSLKRGVLSEDAIWNLLERNRDLKKDIATLVQTDDASMAFRPMRRFKQQMTDDECIALLERAPRGVLAVLGDAGYPYTVPLDFLYADGHLYFHCAREGHKLDAIRRCNKVSFSVLNEGTKEPDSWWYHFDSVVCFGRITIIDDPTHTDTLLRQIGAKYFPQGYDLEDDMQKNAPRAFVLDLKIEHLSGKHVREK